MTEIIWLSIVALCATVVSVLLKKYNPEYSILISISCGVIILFLIIYQIQALRSKIDYFLSVANIDGTYIAILFKAMGICFISQFAADACSDAGENALANKVEFAGKVFIIITALPLFEEVLNTALNLIG